MSGWVLAEYAGDTGKPFGYMLGAPKLHRIMQDCFPRSVRGVLGHDYSEAAEHTITHTLVTIKCEFEYVGHGDERLAKWQAGGVRR